MRDLFSVLLVGWLSIGMILMCYMVYVSPPYRDGRFQGLTAPMYLFWFGPLPGPLLLITIFHTHPETFHPRKNLPGIWCFFKHHEYEEAVTCQGTSRLHKLDGTVVEVPVLATVRTCRYCGHRDVTNILRGCHICGAAPDEKCDAGLHS